MGWSETILQVVHNATMIFPPRRKSNSAANVLQLKNVSDTVNLLTVISDKNVFYRPKIITRAANLVTIKAHSIMKGMTYALLLLSLIKETPNDTLCYSGLVPILSMPWLAIQYQCYHEPR